MAWNKDTKREFGDAAIREYIKVMPIPGGVRVEVDSPKIRKKIDRYFIERQGLIEKLENMKLEESMDGVITAFDVRNRTENHFYNQGIQSIIDEILIWQT